MKRLIAIGIMFVMFFVITQAITDMSKRTSHTIVGADDGSTMLDTFYTRVYNTERWKGFKYIWRTIQLVGVDTGFAVDTMSVVMEHAISKNGPWATVDSFAIALDDITFGGDTLLGIAARLASDSTVRLNNYLRIKLIHEFDMAVGDTAGIAGNRYEINLIYTLVGKF